MIRELLGAAYLLDEWLQTRLGKPYKVLLIVGLVAEIVHQVGELIDRYAGPAGEAHRIIAIVIAAALLIHQMGEISERFQHRQIEPTGDGNPE